MWCEVIEKIMRPSNYARKMLWTVEHRESLRCCVIATKTGCE